VTILRDAVLRTAPQSLAENGVSDSSGL
jgi:hypothetical protein